MQHLQNIVRFLETISEGKRDVLVLDHLYWYVVSAHNGQAFFVLVLPKTQQSRRRYFPCTHFIPGFIPYSTRQKLHLLEAFVAILVISLRPSVTTVFDFRRYRRYRWAHPRRSQLLPWRWYLTSSYHRTYHVSRPVIFHHLISTSTLISTPNNFPPIPQTSLRSTPQNLEIITRSTPRLGTILTNPPTSPRFYRRFPGHLAHQPGSLRGRPENLPDCFPIQTCSPSNLL